MCISEASFFDLLPEVSVFKFWIYLFDKFKMLIFFFLNAYLKFYMVIFLGLVGLNNILDLKTTGCIIVINTQSVRHTYR